MLVKEFLQKFIPFLSLGVVLVFMFIAMVFISHLLIWGVLIGGLLFFANFIKQLITGHTEEPVTEPSAHQGRIIEHDPNA
jgi:hypothetical protein